MGFRQEANLMSKWPNFKHKVYNVTKRQTKWSLLLLSRSFASSSSTRTRTCSLSSFLSCLLLQCFPISESFITQQQPHKQIKSLHNHTHTDQRIQLKTPNQIRLYLSRRCSGVKPSSPFLPFPPARAAALSRSRSLWLPRDDSILKIKAWIKENNKLESYKI